MIYWLKNWTEGARQLKLKFTVLNQNIYNEERIAGRQLPHKTYIKLYHEMAGYTYVPHAKLWYAELPNNQKLSEKINYNWSFLKEQYDILSNIILEWKKSSMIVMKTGRGKAHMVMGLSTMLWAKTLIACHNIKTLNEMKLKFKEFCDYDVGVYYSNKKEIKNITITTHSSLKKKVAEFQSLFWTLIVDEADVGISAGLIKAVALINCEYIFWLTGTPKRKDLSQYDMELIYWETIQIKEQENNGYNIIPTINQILYETNIPSYTSRHDLRKQLIHDEWRKIAQRDVIISLYNSNVFKFWLILVERRDEECLEIYESLQWYIDNLYIIHWKTEDKKDQESIIEMLSKWKWIVIGTVGKMWRGVDITPIDAVFLFFPSRFKSATIQAAGRWLRNSEWKTWCILYDRCDLPILRRQMFDRIASYKEEYWENVIIKKRKLDEFIHKYEKQEILLIENQINLIENKITTQQEKNNMRRCKQCQQEFPLNSEFFSIFTNKKTDWTNYSSFRGKCKQCMVKSVRWRQIENPDKFHANENKRRNLLKNAEWSYNKEDIEEIRYNQQNKCYYCWDILNSKQQIDHKIPLSKWWTNYPWNLVLSCHTCNLDKHAKTDIEFFKWRIRNELKINNLNYK